MSEFYDAVKFGLETPSPDQAQWLGKHLLGQVGLRPEDLNQKKVLEVGTGRGNWTAILAAESTEYQGIDLSPETVEFIKSRYTPNIQVGNAKDLPFEDESFDLSFGIGVLPAVDGDRQAFHELARVLKPGGRLYTMGYGKVWPRNLFRDLAFALGKNQPEEKKNKFCYHLTKLAGWPIPDSWLFRGNQLYAQIDWYFAPVQNRHSRKQLEDWCEEEGLKLLSFIPYPHQSQMRLVEWASNQKGLGRLLSPDYFMIAYKP